MCTRLLSFNMGSGGSSQPQPTPQTIVQTPDTTLISQQYQQSLAQIQQQNNEALARIQQANEQSANALNQQLTQSQQLNSTYQQQLSDYLKKIAESQQQQQSLVSERDSAIKTQQDLQKKLQEGSSLQNNLMAASSVASSQFASNTRRKGLLG